MSQEIADLVDAAMRKTHTNTAPPKYAADHRTLEQIREGFKHHPAHGDQLERYNTLRELSAELARHYARNCPPSRELSLALTKLEEAQFWAVRAIARNEKPPAEPTP